VRLANINPVIVVACSSSEYALSRDGRPIKETDTMQPLSPYAVSKLAMDHCAHLYAVRYKLNVLRVRPFFLIGPGKVGDVCSDLARRVVAVERGEAADVPVGQLDIVRDFLDIRDGIEAMELIAAKGECSQDYNICAGHGYRIAEVLDGYRKLARKPILERVDPSLLRPIDEPVKVGDPGKLKALGWTARYSLEESLAAILEYWRCRP
jgi:GDP-4-dehydro-6-deoxy-D-mannose reductase